MRCLIRIFLSLGVFVTTGFLFLLSACTTTSNPQRPTTDKVLVTVQSDSLINILAPVSRTMRIKVINGEKTSSFFHSETSVELLPGNHVLLIECTVHSGSKIFAGEKEFSIEAQPNQSYEFFIKSIDSDGCSMGFNIHSNNKPLNTNASDAGVS